MSYEISLEDQENIFNRIEELMTEILKSEMKWHPDAVLCVYRQVWQQAVMEHIAKPGPL